MLALLIGLAGGFLLMRASAVADAPLTPPAIRVAVAPTATAQPSATVPPAPPATPTIKALGMGQAWLGKDWRMTFWTARTQPEPDLYLYGTLTLTSLNANPVKVDIELEPSLSAFDNTGRALPVLAAAGMWDDGITSFQSGETKQLAGEGIRIPIDRTNPNVTDVTLKVSNFLGIDNAQWQVQIPRNY